MMPQHPTNGQLDDCKNEFGLPELTIRYFSLTFSVELVAWQVPVQHFTPGLLHVYYTFQSQAPRHNVNKPVGDWFAR